SKISILLGSIPRSRRATVRYMPVDISYSALRDSADIISERFPRIEFNGLVADFLNQMEHIPTGQGRFFCFFGSTLGNLSSGQAQLYLSGLAEVMDPGDNLLLGVDMVKDQKVLESAYNDSRGITAEFNRNILRVANRLAGTDFVPETFKHIAFFNQEYSRIEMHLEAKLDMIISSPHLSSGIPIKKGERIHTENSHKFTPGQLELMIESAGLRIEKLYTDPKKWFSLILIVRD
ncbi:MAG: L-histidine N(alpha)-methyltransferase, partial [Candidatus Latescibacteria bacterium]|nr:L-histidine N(alpha)-methyltransferase [Candidatus Latescibacterota bacterium]